MEQRIEAGALFNIGYGLYAITYNDGQRDNGLIVNTVVQVTSSPLKVAVTINKSNYSHDVIKTSGKMNVCPLTIDTPFEIFEKLGFHSGRDTDKLNGLLTWSSTNGLAVLSADYINSFFSLTVDEYIDLGTHGMFICSVSEAVEISQVETMTYTYYHKNVKPKPQPKAKGFVCKICGYVYEGDSLPEDFECPLCKHGAIDFEEIR
ncbi:MAG: flavin reductase [Clostridia bacterium]|nr:flavin reductase [Clostridia bacterium]